MFETLSFPSTEKLHEQRIQGDTLAIYKSITFDHVIVINDHILASQFDGFFFHEMMSHPALFAHPSPQSIAVVGFDTGITNEIVKHSSVKQVHLIQTDAKASQLIAQYFPLTQDARVRESFMTPEQWVKEATPKSYDIIILSQPYHADHSLLQSYLSLLSPEGMLLQTCPSPLSNPLALQPIQQALQEAGFDDWHILNFPQPCYPSGWRFAMLSSRRSKPKRIREKDIFNRAFKTQYYNGDTHKAALAVPEFLVERL